MSSTVPRRCDVTQLGSPATVVLQDLRDAGELLELSAVRGAVHSA